MQRKQKYMTGKIPHSNLCFLSISLTFFNSHLSHIAPIRTHKGICTVHMYITKTSFNWYQWLPPFLGMSEKYKTNVFVWKLSTDCLFLCFFESLPQLYSCTLLYSYCAFFDPSLSPLLYNPPPSPHVYVPNRPRIKAYAYAANPQTQLDWYQWLSLFVWCARLNIL